MKHLFLRMDKLRVTIFGILFLLPLLGLSQDEYNTQIFPRQKFNHLLNSPTTLTCDSIGKFKVIFTYYKNKMPMADNDQIIWRCGIGQGNGEPIDGANLPVCLKLQEKKIYLFFETEVYVYGTSDKERKKIYYPPQFAVIEYYDSIENKVGYIMTSEFLNYGDVD